jgi:glucosamine kinase
MILIVDSGSTKSDWIAINGSERTLYNTKGLNPYFHTEKTVVQAVHSNEGLSAFSGKVEQVFFYGAGCSSPHLNAIIEKGLENAFPQAKVHVGHDLSACAYATYTGEPAISCIIGTGSNSCFFDGFTIAESVPALGYILGDEGSGSYLGKRLLSDFLYNRLPEKIHDGIVNDLELDKDKIVDRVYRQPDANVFLASMVKFLYQHRLEKYVRDITFQGFKHFIDIHVASFENFKSVPVHFVGSVGYLFRSELEEACNEYEVRLGNVIQKPIDGLVNYHLKNIEQNAS